MGIFDVFPLGPVMPEPRAESADYEAANTATSRGAVVPNRLRFLRWALFTLLAIAMAIIFRVVTLVRRESAR